MERKKTLQGSLLLVLTAFIWGVAFVAQSDGMNYVGGFTFNACRFILGGIVLIPCMIFLRGRNQTDSDGEVTIKDKEKKRNSIIGGIFCGIALCVASSFQQFGIAHTTVGKAGFITALYIVIVPVLGIFLHKKIGLNIWISVAIAVAGMYLLCITEGFSIGRGDFLVSICAVCFSFHILIIDHFSPKGDGILISCVQFFTAGILSSICMFLLEHPQWSDIVGAWLPIGFAGIFSCGVAYTLQVVAQKNVEPTVASLLMSLESVFSVLAGWILLGQKMSAREMLGCVLVFIAIILAQLPGNEKKKENKEVVKV